jgi:predicted CoA-binding protein
MRLESAGSRWVVLAASRSIAVVGASADPRRPSHGVFLYLHARAGIAATPVNPAIDAVGGVRAYPTLAAYAADHGAPDIVNVFRKPAEAARVAREAVAVGAKAIWFQIGAADEEAIALADAAGLAVVANACLKVEYKRLDAQSLAEAEMDEPARARAQVTSFRGG